ncbi:MAG: ABC transporter permease [Clostridiales bacterium]|nr:ABC transporter permease [Clostridiales bacterium]
MNKRFFMKLAAGNIKKNSKAYIPYILTGVMTVAMFYIVKSLSMNPGLEQMIGGDTLTYTMVQGSGVVGFFAFIFLFYTNSFLVKRRKKEFGIFNILGMEKSHLARTVAWETLYMAAISLVGGLIFGIALDKVMYLLISQIVGAQVPLGFFFSGKAAGETVLLFLVIFLMIFLNSVRQIQMSDPIDLLKAGNVGEKEPKTKFFTAAAGLGCLGTGYYIALTTENPIASLSMFFVAVILVIVGTYLLFTAGSIVLLKALRKNKKYYYRTKHFTSVSGMIYRMKQNAVGLANICILSTAVLVMVSSTSSLMLGIEDMIRTRYPYDFVVYADEATKERSYESFDEIHRLQEERNVNVTGEIQYSYLAFSTIREGDTFLVNRSGALNVMDSIANLVFVSLEEYNEVMGKEKTLKENEILVYSNRLSFDDPVLKVFDKEYRVKETLDQFLGNGIIAANAANSHFIVVPDEGEIRDLYEKQKEALGDIASEIRYFYGFDSDGGEKEQEEFFEAMTEAYTANGYQGTLESRMAARTGFVGLYGGFFFIGIFLGVLFIMATVLIIYYKQISEGYDDKERFEIMQKVGMSPQEVKSSIHSQVLTVFFLPLAAAGVHIAVAFPMISKLLALLNLLNEKLYLSCTVVCFLVFGVMYLGIYLLTARTYYRIVKR